MDTETVNEISYHDIGNLIDEIEGLQEEMDMAQSVRSEEDVDRLFQMMIESINELGGLFGPPGTLTMVDGYDVAVVTVDYGTVLVNGKLIDVLDGGGWEELSDALN
jgi:hypothetical protein